MSVERIAKLLQMAEGAKTPEEAAAFLGKAQALATAYEISLAEARLALPKQRRDPPVQERIVVGPKRAQANRHYLRLLSALGRTNGCEVGLYNNNTAAVLFGLPQDIATVKAMFAAIAPQMIRLGEDYLAAGRWRSEMVLDPRTGQPRAVTRQLARASFYTGMTDTLTLRLRAAAAEALAAADARPEPAGHFHDDGSGQGPAVGDSSAALALRAKELEVRAYAAQYLGGGTWRGGRGGPVAPRAYRAGDRAAQGVRLGGQAAVAGGRRAVGR
jgi:hypothetical protein